MPGSEEISRSFDVRVEDDRDPLGERVLAEAANAAAARLGDRLLAAFALGSLAHGGFAPRVSDVDLGLIVADPLLAPDAREIDLLTAEVAAGGSPLHARLSVFWGSPGTLSGTAEGGRFPPLDRLDLLQHGRLVRGREVRAGLPLPGREELVVGGAEFALARLAADETIAAVRRPRLLAGDGCRRASKLALFPARLLFTAETGLVGTNDAAAVHAAAAAAPGARLVAAALRWRASAPEDADALDLLEHELAPLYRHFLADHERRLGALGRQDLAVSFGRWRRRLDA